MPSKGSSPSSFRWHRYLEFTFLAILRDMKSLKTIGIDWDQAWPAAEFWQRYDKEEFK